MKRDLALIILLAVLLRFAYFFFALGASGFSSTYNMECTSGEFYSLFKRNDSYWYQKAAETGYPRIGSATEFGYSSGKYYKQSVWAFFPLYPAAIKFIEKVFHLDFDKSAFILSSLFSITAFVLFYFLCIYLFQLSTNHSLTATIFFMVFPFHYYFSMYYTEAIFFTFMALAFLTIYFKKYWLTGIILIPLVLVRPNGIVCLIPLFFFYVEREGGFKKIYQEVKAGRYLKYFNVFWLATGLLAFGMYCYYQYEMTGYPFAFVKAQAGWYKKFMFPLLALFRRSDFATQFNSIYIIAYMLLCIFTWKKFPLSINLFIWISILFPMCSGSVSGMPRYTSIIFPVIIFLASLLERWRARYIVLAFLCLIQLVTFYPWLISSKFSF